MPTTPTNTLLTPKELAEAIGASESSVRRWVDAGDIHVARTAGGHRRIPVSEAIRFIRQLGAPVVRPDLLGLGTPADETAAAGVSGDQPLFKSLRAGDREAVKSLLASWYLKGQGLAAIFDGPVRAAMGRVGELWKHDGRGILVEHRATDICAEAVALLRGLLPPPADDAPLALGGAPHGDPYQLPSMIVAAVLAEAGLRSVNFGPNTPVELLAKEAVDRGARVMWLSLSAPVDAAALRTSLAEVASELAKHDIRLVLGGRHHLECAPPGQANVAPVATMSELAAFAGGLVDASLGGAAPEKLA